MKYAVTALLIPVLGSAFFGKSAEAIKCHICNECANPNNLIDAIECTKITLAEGMASITGKRTGLRVSEKDKTMIVEKLRLNLETPPASCFKLQEIANNEVIVSRGCSVAIQKDECRDRDGIRTCMCQGDGCNSAPAAFVASLMAVCISLFLSFT